MTNHFHLLIHQVTQTGVTEFVRALCTSYSMYFNKKYHRVGHLFQGVFKAAHVDRDAYLLHLTRYIHRNPLKVTGLNPVSVRGVSILELSILSAAQAGGVAASGTCP